MPIHLKDNYYINDTIQCIEKIGNRKYIKIITKKKSSKDLNWNITSLKISSLTKLKIEFYCKIILMRMFIPI